MSRLQVRTHRITANGLSFAADECGSGDAVALLLHGFPESRFSWRHQLGCLADAGWRAVAPDLRGYGETSRPEGRRAYEMDRLVADVAALFDARGARRRLLIGHDWGALVAWTVAMRRTRPLDGLIVINVPHPEVFRSVLRTSWPQRLRSWYVLFFQLPWLPEALLGAGRAWAVGAAIRGTAVDKAAFPAEVVDRYRRGAMDPGALTAMIDYYRANFRSFNAPGISPAPPIDIPTLMIWGEEDQALGLELTEGYEPYVRDFTLRRLPDVSHWAQQESPLRVNLEIETWLAAKGLRPPPE